MSHSHKQPRSIDRDKKEKMSSLPPTQPSPAGVCLFVYVRVAGMMRPPGASLLLASSSSSSSPIIHATTSTTTTHATVRLTRRTLLSLPLAGVVFTAHQAQAQAQAQPPSTTTTPYAQSRTLQLGLDANGKIRTCPSTNPGCVCTNPTVGASSSVASPLLIPDTVASAGVAAQLLRQAILKTQKNVIFRDDQQTTPPDGASVYIQAEVDGGGFRGRDVMEFLVKKDAGVVAYRCVATEVTFVYPFTTAVGDSRGQEQRIAAIAQDLGWYAPDIRSSLDDLDAN